MFPINLDLARLSVALVGNGQATLNRLRQLDGDGAKYVPVYAAIAKAVGTIANVEDVKEYCDFFSPARVTRGDLMITVSTNGHSPRLAGRIRHAIENWLVPKWDQRLRELSDQREKWKADGADMQQLLKMTDDYIDRRGWL